MESQEEHEEHQRKQYFDYLTSDLLKEKKKHTLATAHFLACGDIIFYTSTLITLVQAVLAVLAQSQFKKSQDEMNIAIAILAAFSVFWQSLIKHWNYGGKSMMHESAATALGKIHGAALLRSRLETVNMAKVSSKGTRTNGDIANTGDDNNMSGSNTIGASNNVVTGGGEEDEKSTESLHLDHPEVTPGEEDSNDDGSGLIEGDSSDTQTAPVGYKGLMKQFEQATASCTSQVPAQIAAAFELLDNRVGACKRKVHNPRKSSENYDIKVEWEKVYPSLYRQLTATIIAQPFWPYKYPDPETVVNETLKKYTRDLKETALLDDLLKSNLEIDKKYDAFENDSSDQIA